MPPATVEVREHPFGEKGVQNSLEEVARRATEGGLRPDVRRWAIEMLDKARKAGDSVNTPVDRARVLLSAVQEKLWVPDPVGTEFIQGAHLTACTDPDSPCFQGGDCDDLVVLLGAAFLSVGLDTLVVGHAYDQQKTIGHVLAAVHLNGKWHYADPSPVGSTHQPLGRCVPFTRERLYSLPNAAVICDENACLSSGRAFNPESFVERGTFVGVTGTPEFAYRLQWLDGVDEPDLGTWRESFPWAPPQWVGQPQQVEQAPLGERKLSTIEKILLASVIISATSLAIRVWELNNDDARRRQPT